MTFKEAKSEMEKMLPNGVWLLSYEHWQFSCGPETKCKIYVEDTGSSWSGNWQDCIDAVKERLYPKPKETQDDPDTEQEREPGSGWLERAEATEEYKRMEEEKNGI
jgi:hypothetical protein